MIEYHKSKLCYARQWKNCPEYKAWIRMNRFVFSEQANGRFVDIYWDWTWRKRNEKDSKVGYDRFRKFIGPRPEGHVLVRLDKRVGFTPGNVRWGTHQENSQHRGPYKKFSYSRDEELIAELERRGYGVTPQKLRG